MEAQGVANYIKALDIKIEIKEAELAQAIGERAALLESIVVSYVMEG